MTASKISRVSFDQSNGLAKSKISAETPGNTSATAFCTPNVLFPRSYGSLRKKLLARLKESMLCINSFEELGFCKTSSDTAPTKSAKTVSSVSVANRGEIAIAK